MSPLDAFGLTLFIILLFLGIFLCIHGLPGMVLIVVDVLFYSIITGFEKIGWQAVLVLMSYRHRWWKLRMFFSP